MPLTQKEAEAIRIWVPRPWTPSPTVAAPPTEKFLRQWAGSPTPSDSLSEAVWARDGLSYLHSDDLTEVASAVLRSHIPHTISLNPPSVEIIKGLVRNLFDYGAPLKMFVYAGDVLSRLPRTRAFAEKWRLMGPDLPRLDPYDINDPEGLELPSITYSPHRLPSYFRPLPRTPAYRSELLVLVALAAGAKAVGSPLRPFNEIRYWTMGVAGGRWSEQQLIAAEEVFFPWLDTVTFTEEGIWAIKDEMENIGVLRGKLFTWI